MTASSISKKVVVLGTGGTIAGTASSARDNIGYTAAQVDVDQLLSEIPGLDGVLAGRSLIAEQVAQLDSKDMSFEVWLHLRARVIHHLAQVDVAGVVITHGTDTLEETAFFLHSTLSNDERQGKPVVLTCAMRPASALTPDGPQNVMDAVAVVCTPGASGVVAVCAGVLHGAVDVQKVHSYRLEAFDSGDSGPLGYLEEGMVRLVRNWPETPVSLAQAAIKSRAMGPIWPRVEIVMNYAGASGIMVDALVSAGTSHPSDANALQGLVVAATGNGTLHHDLEAALLRAQRAGVSVVVASRCTRGRVMPTLVSPFIDSQGLSPVKARVALMLALMK